MKPASLFSPSLRLWKPWKTASGLHTVPTACVHPLFPLWLSPYTKISVHFLSRKRTVATTNRGQRIIMAKKSKRHTGGFILKKAPKHDKNKPSTTPFDVMLGFSWLQRFSADKAMRCLQIALSHFAAWRGNVLFRKISRAEAYRVHSIVLCFLIYFFAQE